jgi:outer membrane receptor protein involved in Fe transport
VVRDTDPSAFGSFGVGPIKSVDGTLLNIAEAKYEAYDVQLDYSLSTSNLGGFDFSLMGTRQIHAQTRLIMSSPLVENVGLTYNNPSKYKANSAITWSARGWTAGWNSRYISSYTVSTAAATIQNQGGPTVPSQIYHDVFVKYRFADLTGGVVNSALANLEVKLGVTNVLNKEPPYDAFASNVYYSLYGDPRLATYQLSLSKAF